MDVKWIKLSTGIFDNRKIRQIEALPDGDALIVVWLKLLVLAGETNDGGLVYFTRDIPYTDQLLATQFNRPLPTIQLALRVFEQYGMITITDNLICVTNWERYQSSDKLAEIREYNRLAQQKSRERKRLQAVNDMSMTCQPCQDTDIDIDIDKDKEKSNRRFTPPTADEVKAYCKERGNGIDAERFCDFYASKGWKVGNQPMKDWKACVRTWERKSGTKATPDDHTLDGIL